MFQFSSLFPGGNPARSRLRPDKFSDDETFARITKEFQYEKPGSYCSSSNTCEAERINMQFIEYVNVYAALKKSTTTINQETLSHQNSSNDLVLRQRVLLFFIS